MLTFSPHLSQNLSQKEQQKIVVVGNGMVGHHFITQMAALADGSFKLSTFGEEPRLAYDRVRLSTYFAGNTADDLALGNADTYSRSGIEYHLNQQVSSIDRQSKSLITTQGTRVNYDKLILATGSAPFVPSIKGVDLTQPHQHVYRTLTDLDDIAKSAKSANSGVVIGGGLLGLEAANALKQLGLPVDVVEFSADLMAAQLDHGGSEMLREKIAALNVNVHTAKNTTAITAGENSRYCLTFADGSSLDTDLIIFSAGIRPQDQLAKQAGLNIAERGGIVINNQCQSSDRDIYAIGECASWQQRIFGLVAPGYRMAEVAVSHLIGGDKTFIGADMSTKLKLLDIEVASIGDAHGRTAGAQSFTEANPATGIYKKVVISQDGQQLLGAIMVGDSSDYDQLRLLVLNKGQLNGSAQSLLLGEAESVDSGVAALPANSQICGCYDVSKKTLCQAIANGAKSTAALSQCTGAGSGCGSCLPLVSQILDHALTPKHSNSIDITTISA